jgi:hypothetical protein
VLNTVTVLLVPLLVVTYSRELSGLTAKPVGAPAKLAIRVADEDDEAKAETDAVPSALVLST